MFIYREAVARDIPEMVELLRQLFSIEKDFSFHPGKHRAGLLMMINSGSCRIFLAETDGHIAGMCTVQVLTSSAEGGKVGLLEDMVVDENFRRQGVGSFLLEKATVWAEESGLKCIQLLADKDNIPALKFYRKYNWSLTNPVSVQCFRNA
ncbi:MAG: GNAT family N-acetyltransferase [Victivallales bacterium]